MGIFTGTFTKDVHMVPKRRSIGRKKYCSQVYSVMTKVLNTADVDLRFIYLLSLNMSQCSHTSLG